MPDGPKPTKKINFDDFQLTPDVADGGPHFTRADDKILMDMKDEIIHAANEEAVYKQIQRQVCLECRRHTDWFAHAWIDRWIRSTRIIATYNGGIDSQRHCYR